MIVTQKPVRLPGSLALWKWNAYRCQSLDDRSVELNSQVINNTYAACLALQCWLTKHIACNNRSVMIPMGVMRFDRNYCTNTLMANLYDLEQAHLGHFFQHHTAQQEI